MTLTVSSGRIPSLCSLHLFPGWLLVLRSGVPPPENIDTSHPYNFNWLPLLATCPHTATLAGHTHWLSLRTELSNSHFPLQCVQQGKGLSSTQECSPTQWLAVWAWLWNCTPYLVDGWFLCLIPPAKRFLYLAAPVKWFFIWLSCWKVALCFCWRVWSLQRIWMGEFSFSGCFPESQIFKMKVI